MKHPKKFHTIDTRLDDTCKTHLNQLATEMLNSAMLASNLFQSLRTTTQTWLVVLLAEHSPSKSIIPKMKHVRTVTLFENTLTCSCSEMIVYRLPCRHVLHVASTIPNWKRPTHHDVPVRWWEAYYYYGITDNLKTDSDRTIQKMLRLLRKKETVGLNVRIEDVCKLPINIPT